MTNLTLDQAAAIIEAAFDKGREDGSAMSRFLCFCPALCFITGLSRIKLPNDGGTCLPGIEPDDFPGDFYG